MKGFFKKSRPTSHTHGESPGKGDVTPASRGTVADPSGDVQTAPLEDYLELRQEFADLRDAHEDLHGNLELTGVAEKMLLGQLSTEQETVRELESTLAVSEKEIAELEKDTKLIEARCREASAGRPDATLREELSQLNEAVARAKPILDMQRAQCEELRITLQAEEEIAHEIEEQARKEKELEHLLSERNSEVSEFQLKISKLEADAEASARRRESDQLEQADRLRDLRFRCEEVEQDELQAAERRSSLEAELASREVALEELRQNGLDTVSTNEIAVARAAELAGELAVLDAKLAELSESASTRGLGGFLDESLVEPWGLMREKLQLRGSEAAELEEQLVASRAESQGTCDRVAVLEAEVRQRDELLEELRQQFEMAIGPTERSARARLRTAEAERAQALADLAQLQEQLDEQRGLVAERCREMHVHEAAAVAAAVAPLREEIKGHEDSSRRLELQAGESAEKAARVNAELVECNYQQVAESLTAELARERRFHVAAAETAEEAWLEQAALRKKLEDISGTAAVGDNASADAGGEKGASDVVSPSSARAVDQEFEILKEELSRERRSHVAAAEAAERAWKEQGVLRDELTEQLADSSVRVLDDDLGLERPQDETSPLIPLASGDDFAVASEFDVFKEEVARERRSHMAAAEAAERAWVEQAALRKELDERDCVDSAAKKAGNESGGERSRCDASEVEGLKEELARERKSHVAAAAAAEKSWDEQARLKRGEQEQEANFSAELADQKSRSARDVERLDVIMAERDSQAHELDELRSELTRERADCAAAVEKAEEAQNALERGANEVERRSTAAFGESLSDHGVGEVRAADSEIPSTALDNDVMAVSLEAEALRAALAEETAKCRRLGKHVLRAEEGRRRLLYELAEDAKEEADLTELAKVVGRAARAIATLSKDAPPLHLAPPEESPKKSRPHGNRAPEAGRQHVVVQTPSELFRSQTAITAGNSHRPPSEGKRSQHALGRPDLPPLRIPTFTPAANPMDSAPQSAAEGRHPPRAPAPGESMGGVDLC